MLLVWDNLAGHQTPEMVLWLCAQGILPLYTPISGSWLNMAESIQRILTRRALNRQHPDTPEQIIEWLETTAKVWINVPLHLNGEESEQHDDNEHGFDDSNIV